MQDDTEKIIKEQFKLLPSDIREALMSPSFEKQIDFIRTSHDLGIDKSLPLQNETTLLLLGFAEPSEYLANLSESLGISIEEASLIANDVNQFIIAPIRTSLIQFTNSQKDKKITSQTPEEIKKDIPIKDFNPFLPPLSKNVVVPRIVVPPNVTVSEAFSGPAPAPLSQELQTPMTATGEVVARMPGKTTPVTSALAAELGNLLDQKPKIQTPQPSPVMNKPATPPPAPAPVAPKVEPPSNLPVSAAPELPSTSVLPPKPPTAQVPTMPKPGESLSKLNTMTQKPRVEVEMVKNAPQSKQNSDPYREPVE